MHNNRKLFMKAYIRTTKAQTDFKNVTVLKRVVLYGVKMINRMPESVNMNDCKICFDISSYIKDCVGFLTPNEFMTVFPVAKDFDGHKYEIKDYFYTMDYINKLDRNKPINEQVDPLEFLWEYQNWEVHHFNIEVMRYLSNLRQADGHLGLFEEFMAAQGMETNNTFKNTKGEAMYVRNGKPQAVGFKTNKLELVK